MRYIYLDWVVLQHMKHLTISDGVHGPDFVSRVEALSVQYVFPISQAHISEMLSPKATLSDDRAKDIALLKAVSNGAVVQIRCGIPSVEPVPLDAFINAVEALPNEESMPPVSFERFQASVDTATMDKNHPFLRPLVEAGGNLDEALLEQMVQDLMTASDEPASYKAFRQQVAKAPSVIRKGRPTVVDKRSEGFRRVLPVFDFLAARAIADVEAQLVPAAKALAEMGGSDWNAFPRDCRIELALGLLDFHADFHDKTRTDNPPRNMQRDAEHFCFASEAAWFVTEDRGLLKKARVVGKAFDLAVKVVLMADFLADGPAAGVDGVGQSTEAR
ncbi:hypothetical protein L2Y96_13765 [Luteibacter aegosomaticola]|uniref:hypothetical protein n=1 Tax=Luteibacter aegosomaticola TaxID=2911538 RepID=UPI001FFB7BCA|nr:hypothetical protein [Luteibacter aegosomaticola]UPG88485.1 hypothetical protein L2Y96_13765 [Luteibacter aegosomaticola]